LRWRTCRLMQSRHPLAWQAPEPMAAHLSAKSGLRKLGRMTLQRVAIAPPPRHRHPPRTRRRRLLRRTLSPAHSVHRGGRNAQHHILNLK
jgi:hypothetical protein